MEARAFWSVGGALLIAACSSCDNRSVPPASSPPASTSVSAPSTAAVPITSAAPTMTGGVGDACGTRGANGCAAPLFCDYQPGADCGRADAPGRCAARPQTCITESAPVCGCDGKTYDNACRAAMAGVGVDKKGACN